MKTLNDVLLSQPEMRFEISNNEQAKQFLAEFGLTGQIRTDIAESKTQIFTTDDHKTHYFVVMYVTGKIDPSENGYLINCVPKATVSKEKFVNYLRQVAALHSNVESIAPLKRGSEQN